MVILSCNLVTLLLLLNGLLCRLRQHCLRSMGQARSVGTSYDASDADCPRSAENGRSMPFGNPPLRAEYAL